MIEKITITNTKWLSCPICCKAVHMSGMGITYPLPCLTAEKEKPVGVYGQRHLRHLKEYRNALIFFKSALLSSCNLERAFQPFPQ